MGPAVQKLCDIDDLKTNKMATIFVAILFLFF